MKTAALVIALAWSPLTACAQTPEQAGIEPQPGVRMQTQRPESMQQMQAHMQTMRQTMAQIQSEQDPAAQRRLMQQHMQSMHAGMATMGQMMRGQQNGGDPSAAQCPDGDAQCRMDRMQMHHGMMAERMGMMQQMMQQMMEHMMRHESAPGTVPPAPSPDTGTAPPSASAPASEDHEQHH